MFWRNELAWRVAGQAVYSGFDKGKVRGPSVAFLLCDRLGGAEHQDPIVSARVYFSLPALYAVFALGLGAL